MLAFVLTCLILSIIYVPVVVLGVKLYSKIQARKQISTPEPRLLPTKKKGRYGYPFDPIEELIKVLPDKPPGFSWQVEVIEDPSLADKAGWKEWTEPTDQFIRLTLLNLDKEIASSTRNLTAYKTTWKDKSGAPERNVTTEALHKGKTDKDKLYAMTIATLADWAKLQVVKNQPRDEPELRIV